MPGDVERLRQMITGYTISQLIAVAATLDLADVMAKDAMTPEQLATKTVAHGPALTRLLHALVALGLAEVPHAGQFRMTALAPLLRKGAPECDLALMAEANSIGGPGATFSMQFAPVKRPLNMSSV
jgi:hypothetical protein